LAGLLAELDDERFKVRERATRALEKLAETAEPPLKKALAGDPSPEARRRIEGVLDKLKKDRLNPPADRTRLVRAVEVLELIGSAEARQVLNALARGAPEAQITLEAKTALERLSR
jgi:HEAT repeat protein